MKITTIMLTLSAALAMAQDTKPNPKTADPSPKEASAGIPGLKIARQAPPFTLKNQDEKDLELAQLLKKGPVALVFFRSADW